MNKGFIKFNLSHVLFNDLRRHEQIFLGIDYKKILEDLSKKGPTWTLIYDGQPVSFFGGFYLWDGVMEIWQIPTIHVAKCPKFYSKMIKFFVDKYFELFHLHRMQSTCLDDALHNRWMRFLGFKKEGILKKYNWNKADYCIFAKVR